MGGSSSSSSQATTSKVETTTFTASNIQGPAIIGHNNTMEMVDHGAIEAAGNVAEKALALGEVAIKTGERQTATFYEFQSDAYGKALDFAEDISKGAMGQISNVVAGTENAQKGIEAIKWVGISVAAAMVLAAGVPMLRGASA